MLFCKPPKPTPVSDGLLQSAKEAEQQLWRLLTQQQYASASPVATSSEHLQQLHAHINEYFLQPAVRQLETQEVKLHEVIEHLKSQVVLMVCRC